MLQCCCCHHSSSYFSPNFLSLSLATFSGKQLGDQHTLLRGRVAKKYLASMPHPPSTKAARPRVEPKKSWIRRSKKHKDAADADGEQTKRVGGQAPSLRLRTAQVRGGNLERDEDE